MTLTVAGVGAQAVSEELTRKVSVFGDSDVRSTIGWMEIAGLGCMVETPSEVEHGLFTSKSTRESGEDSLLQNNNRVSQCCICIHKCKYTIHTIIGILGITTM